MSENLDYDTILKTVLSWPRRDQMNLLHAVVDGLAAAPAEHREKTALPMPAMAPPAPVQTPPTPMIMIDSAPPPKPGGRLWVDETST